MVGYFEKWNINELRRQNNYFIWNFCQSYNVATQQNIVGGIFLENPACMQCPGTTSRHFNSYITHKKYDGRILLVMMVKIVLFKKKLYFPKRYVN
jgi:hypothetical protein